MKSVEELKYAGVRSSFSKTPCVEKFVLLKHQFKLTDGDIVLYMVLCDLTGGGEHDTRVTNLYLAAVCDTTQTTISRRLKNLKTANLVMTQMSSKKVGARFVKYRTLSVVREFLIAPLDIAELNNVEAYMEEGIKKWRLSDDMEFEPEIPTLTIEVPENPHKGSQGPCTPEEWMEWQCIVHLNSGKQLSFVDSQGRELKAVMPQ